MKQKNRLLIFVTAVFLLIYSVWRLGWTIPTGRGIVPVVCWVILTIVEFVGFFELALFINGYIKKEDIVLPKVDDKDLPDVDVFIFTINESEGLLSKTIYACKKMKYPDLQKVHIYLCDDGARESMRELSNKMGINYLCRNDNTDAKAGNFNYAMIKSKSPLIAIFDADMMPKEDFLLKTAPYFVEDSKVGFVQTPQYFYKKDIFQKSLNIPHNEQDYFYQVIQKTKNSSNSVILAGSNTLISRAAVEEIGGFVTGTVTEDFATGIAIEQRGFKGIAINEVLAQGLPPMDYESFIRQRRRWAKGCIQSGKKTKYLTNKNLSVKQKMNYFSSIVYWYSSIKRLIYMVAPMLFCLAGVGVMRCEPWEIALFWFPLYGCIYLCIHLLSDKIRNLYWTNIYETFLMPFLLPAVIKEFLGFHYQTFDVTSKEQTKKNRTKIVKYLIPFVALLTLTIVSLALVIYKSYIEAAYHYVILIVYLLINCHYLYTACKIVVGSADEIDESMFNIQDSVQYKDNNEQDFVNIKTLAMGEDAITTATYDEQWTDGIIRIPIESVDNGYIDVPVSYEKGGKWKVDTSIDSNYTYPEYVYYLFNR